MCVSERAVVEAVLALAASSTATLSLPTCSYTRVYLHPAHPTLTAGPQTSLLAPLLALLCGELGREWLRCVCVGTALLV